jgi:hypothetical protein
MLAQCCIVYLLRIRGDEWRKANLESAYPLIRYAAEWWTHHARASGIASKEQQNLSLELLTQYPAACSAWLLFVETPTSMNINEPNALRAASAEGLIHTVKAILATEHTNKLYRAVDKRAALYAASMNGYKDVVQTLLSAGVRPNVPCALERAAENGFDEVVKILLDAGASVNGCSFKDYIIGTPLQYASSAGQISVVQRLLRAGASVNTCKDSSDSAIQLASRWGHDQVVQILIEAGADVNARGGAMVAHCMPQCCSRIMAR